MAYSSTFCQLQIGACQGHLHLPLWRLASLVAQTVKNLPAMQGTWVRSLGWEDPLEKGMATHSSILVWRTPWTEEPGRHSPWGGKESDTAEGLTLSLSDWILSYCSCCTSTRPKGASRWRMRHFVLQGNWWNRFWIVRYFQKPISWSQSLHLLVSKFSSAQSLSRVRLFATPWIAARQASLPITNSRSLLKLMSTESGMPSNHLILCHPLLLLPSIFPSIRVFSDESVLHILVSRKALNPFMLTSAPHDQQKTLCEISAWLYELPLHQNPYIDLPPLPLWSSLLELSEVLSPRLHSSFCPK